VEFATPLPHDEERIDAYHNGEPLQYRTMENLLGDQPVPVLAHTIWRRSCILRATTASLGPSQRPRDVAWRAAMQSEMDAVEKNCTRELADLPRGHSVITLKWV
jgi:hypothetical protein